MRVTSEAGSRRRIPTRGRSTTCAPTTGIWRRRAAYRGTQDGSQRPKRHPGGTKMGPPEFGASPSLKWKDCDSSAMVKTQVEFLARAQKERKAPPRSPKNCAGRISDNPGQCRDKLALGFAAECPSRRRPEATPLADGGKSTFELGSCIHRPLWRAAVWPFPHSRVGGRFATTTTQSEAFSESLP